MTGVKIFVEEKEFPSSFGVGKNYMMGKHKKALLAGLSFFILSLWAAGYKEERGLQQQKHEVEVRLILVDVIATKGGEFFPGLKLKDFELFEDGNEININSCDLISLGKSDLKVIQEKKTLTADIVPKRRLAVLFDGINAWDRELKKAAQQIADELVPLAKSDVEVMVLFLDNQKGLKIIQPFTDQEELIRAATAKSAEGAFFPSQELLDYNDLLFMARYVGQDGSGGYENLGLLRPFYEMRTFEHANIVTDKLTRTIGGLLASIYMLENLPGRKNLLFVSSGFPDIDTFRVGDLRTSINDQFARTGRINIFDPFGILGKKLFQTGDEVLKEIIRVANDRNTSIYSLDPGIFAKNIFAGASAEYFDRESAESQKILINERYRQLQNLRMLSEKTGAELLRGSNKIESFRQMLRNDLRYYYQLSYYPPKKKSEPGYHKIQVRVKGRDDIQIRFREGYSDSPIEATKRLILAKAFYNPDLFLNKLPLSAEFIPFSLGSGKYRPWMNVALAGREFFKDRFAGNGKKAYELHFWIKGKDEANRVLVGNVAMPLDFDSPKDRLSSLDFLRFHFIGPSLELPESEYRVVFALFDPETGDIGTWITNLAGPPVKGAKDAAIINCILGYATPSEIDKKGSFSLNDKDGSLEFGQMKFFPKIAGSFSRTEGAFIFCQIYYPQGSPIEARFDLIDENGLTQRIEGEKVAESWDKSSKVWSGAFKLGFKNVTAGDYNLIIEIPSLTAAPQLIKKMKLALF